jgi:hypothetical protein
MGNNSLVKLDSRYGRIIQRANTIMKNGVRELCNNYLKFRGREGDINNFDVEMRDVITADDASRVDEFISKMSIFDTMSTLSQTYGDYLDTSKTLWNLFKLVGLDPTDFSSDKLEKDIKSYEAGLKRENLKPSSQEENPGGGFGEEDFGGEENQGSDRSGGGNING